MSKTLSNELVELNHLNGYKSARNECGITTFEERFNNATHNNITLITEYAKSDILKKVVTYYNKPKQGKPIETSLRIAIKDPMSGKETKKELTTDVLLDIWSNPSFTVKNIWPTVLEFINMALNYIKLYNNAVTEHRVERIKTLDPAIEYLSGVNIERVAIPLGTTLCKPQISAADREFIYDHLRSNSGELYWLCDDVLYPIFKIEKSNAISKDCEFLTNSWINFAYPYIQKYQAHIISLADTILKQQSVPQNQQIVETLQETQKFEELLHVDVPRFVIKNINLVQRIRVKTDKDSKGNNVIIKQQDGFEIALKSNSKNYDCSMEAWRDTFASKLLDSVQFNEVARIKQFSNTVGGGIQYFSLDGIDTNGIKHDKRPELPPHWSAFFFGRNGNKPLFACDVEMSLLRVAYYICNLVTENGYTRQILFCAGGGNDGKTTFCETLRDLMGANNAISLNPNQLDNDANRIGLINKSFVYMPDVKRSGDILDNPVVKQLTGRDTMPMRKLYCSPFSYTPEHTFVAVSTNSTVYAKGEHQTSRILPLSFQINYTMAEQKSPEQMRVELLSERNELLQWCFDMKRYYSERLNVNGEKLQIFKANSMLLITDENYNKWLNGELSFTTDDQKTERQLQTQLELDALNNGPGRFVATPEQDMEECDMSFFSKLIQMFFVLDKDAKCTKGDIQLCLVENANNLIVKTIGFKISNLAYCGHYRAFLKYIESLNGVKEVRVQHNNMTVRGFSGIRLKEDPTAMYTETNEGGDEQTDMEL